MNEDIRVGGGPERQMNPMGSRNGSRNNMPWIILAVVVLLVIIGAVLFRDSLFPSQDEAQTGTAQEETLSGYQAVFLTNGQVYFGKLSDVSATYATLNDIYYLQVTQPPLQGSQPEGAQQQQPQLSLVKLGQELHGPVDEMKINREQILFYEDIKEDGRVMQAIREYQKNPPANNQQSGQQQQAPATQPQQQAPATQPQQQAPATQPQR